MRTKHIFLVLTTLLSNNTYARDLTTCYDTPYEEGGYLILSPINHTDVVCWSPEEISNYGVDCNNVFHTGFSSNGPWSGYFDGYNIDTCYINVPAGYMLDTDFIFDEDRYDEAIKLCYSGSYCPNDNLVSYSKIMTDHMGGTSEFSETYPQASNTYTNSSLKNTAYTTSDVGTKSIYECYLPAGTYYDVTGTFKITADSQCFYTD